MSESSKMIWKRDAGDFRKFLPGQFIDDLSELQVELNKLFGLLKIIFIILVFFICVARTPTPIPYIYFVCGGEISRRRRFFRAEC